MDQKEKKDEIKVEDRRLFDREGNPREPSESVEQTSVEQPKTEETKQPKEEEQPKIDFITILFSYVHTALIHLGDVEDPMTKTTTENLEGARQMIDILELLQVKTKGNLSKQEEQYLESALFDLRMRFVEKTSGNL